jgi:hypothetical protein
MLTNYNVFISKTNWTLVVTILLAVGNAVVPFMSDATAAVVTTILGALAMIFHVSGVNRAAVASANAARPVSGQ